MGKAIKVYMPIGLLAGQEVDLSLALFQLSIEAMSVKSDIEDRMKNKSAAEELGALEWQFERVSFALAVIAWQLDPGPTAGFIERAKEFIVTLPPGFTEEEIPKNANFIPKKGQIDFLSD